MEAKNRADALLEGMRVKLRTAEDQAGKRFPDSEALIDEWQSIAECMVSASYLLSHSKRLVEYLNGQQGLSEAAQTEVDYLKANLKL